MKKLLIHAAIMSFILSNALTAYSDVPVNMLPVYKNGENVGVTTNSNNMNIQIQGGANSVGTANWKSFHIGKDASVNVEFTNQNQTSLNYVDATGGMSQIYGKFTDSGAGVNTGKIILHNPNGIFFGNGANVNVNSLTATTMNGVYDKDSQTLKLTKNANANKDYGIVVDSGAKINGRHGIAFASNNIDVYKGSQISSIVSESLPDGSNYSYIGGNIKLVTSDGVNFKYVNGTLNKASDVKNSQDKMMLYVAGDNTNTTLEGKNIELINSSENVNSQINMKGAVLKAYSSNIASDGNIILTSGNKVVTENVNLTTHLDSFVTCVGESADNTSVNINAKNNVSLNKSSINARGAINLKSENGNVNVHNSDVESNIYGVGRNVTLEAGNVASVQINSKIKGGNITIKGGLRGQVVNSDVSAYKDINIESDKSLAWTNNAKVSSDYGDINIKSNQDGVMLQSSEFETKGWGNVNVQAYKDIKSFDLENSTFNAKQAPYTKEGGNISVKSSNNLELNDLSQFKAENKLNLGGAAVKVDSDKALNIKNTNFEAFDIELKSSDNLTIDGDTTNFKLGFPDYTGMFVSDAVGSVTLEAGKDVKTTGAALYLGQYPTIKAGKNIDVNLKSLDGSWSGVYATAEKDMTITTDGTLSVGNLTAGNDMTLNAKNVIQGGAPIMSGDPYIETRKTSTDKKEIPNISVGGTFTSNVENNYEVVSSTGESADGKYATEHIIKYGDANFYLKNKLPVQPQITPPVIKPRDLAGEDEV